MSETAFAALRWRDKRQYVMWRDDYTCVYCGRQLEPSRLHVDHWFPFSRGGEDTLGNLLTACSRCNLRKSATLVQAPAAYCIVCDARWHDPEPDEVLAETWGPFWICFPCRASVAQQTDGTLF